MAGALLDQLLHHASVLTCGPRSWRTKLQLASDPSAITAAERGRRVYYATLADLILWLEEAQLAGQMPRRVRTLVTPSLMVIDKIGYLSISRTGAQLFSQLMSRRCEHASTVLTSNKGFEA